MNLMVTMIPFWGPCWGESSMSAGREVSGEFGEWKCSVARRRTCSTTLRR